MDFFTKNEKINLSTLQIKVKALDKNKFPFSKIVKSRFYLLQKAQTTNLKKENFLEDKFGKNSNSLNKKFYTKGFQEEKNNKSDGPKLYNSLKNIKIKQSPPSLQKTSFSGPQKVHIYLAEKRKLQIGDKIAGRHGNKGIISNVLPRQDMPYLSDGTPLDIVLNPLGVPSRMNVGQIFECLLGMAGYYLKQNYKIQPFDEIYGCEASRSLVYSKLYEARIKTGQDWLFNPNHPGKTRLFDGRTGDCFKQPVTVGVAYILKLIHLVDDKIHARSTGPYSLVTQQPLRGRSKQGGQRVGEMEVWALEGFGAAYILQEILTIKSDDLKGRNQVINSILNNKPVNFGLPESFKVLVRELQSLCLDIAIYRYGENGIPTKININNFC
jgi:DNA-directed RNA polymerase subunit beta